MAMFVRQIVRFAAKNINCARNSPLSSVRPSRCSTLSQIRPITSTTQCAKKAERWYTDKHEWVRIEEKIGTVGISNYAQDALGDVVFAQLPDVGAIISKQDECGALESVKAASELTSPVSGKVVEKNEAVENKPGLINTSCYEEGWLFKIELSDPSEIESLMNEASYTEFLKTDPH